MRAVAEFLGMWVALSIWIFVLYLILCLVDGRLP